MGDNTKAFSIGFGDEDDKIPGVTALLNPKAMAAKARAVATPAAGKAEGKTAAKTENEAQHFTLSFDENRNHTMPGVSALLNPADLEIKSKAGPTPPPILRKAQAPVPAQTTPAKSTSDITVVLDVSSFITREPAPAKNSPLLSEKTSMIDGNEIALNLELETFSDQATGTHLQSRIHEAQPHNASNSELSLMGVHFELHFEKRGGDFRYARMKPHARASFELWQQKFFYEMKLDVRTLEIQVSFQEFAKKQNPFQEDAFGLGDAHYVQIIRLEDQNDKIFVLLSASSLLQRQAEVRQALSGKSNSGSSDDGDSFKIELAS